MYDNGTGYLVQEKRAKFAKVHELCDAMQIPADERPITLGLEMSIYHVARLLFLSELYKKIIDVHGVVMEFGTHWGNNISWLSTLHSLYEPFNKTRKIVAFDTFSGFAEFDGKDGKSSGVFTGNFGLPAGHVQKLQNLIKAKDDANGILRTNTIEFIKGDICVTVPKYMDAHPETVVALAYLDVDIYKPTKSALEAILNAMPKGSILAFDEACNESWPGETVAIAEVLGMRNIRLQRSALSNGVSYCVL